MSVPLSLSSRFCCVVCAWRGALPPSPCTCSCSCHSRYLVRVKVRVRVRVRGRVRVRVGVTALVVAGALRPPSP